MKRLLAGLLLCVTLAAGAEPLIEPHHRLMPSDVAPSRNVALTLDACGSGFDADLIALLVVHRVPATIFVTRKWLDRNPAGAAELLAHDDLFELEDHGRAHVPAMLEPGRRVYGMRGSPDVAHLRAEVSLGAEAITRLSGRAPRYYRGATALYDSAAMKAILDMGYTIAGFSVNADAGATLSRAGVAARLRSVQAGDIIIAHMNKPAGSTAEGFAIALPELLARGFRFVKLSDARLQPI
jgi:peptidoglycan/xylan/chitin deacetylase (PgdA/CDA1 family)